MIAVLALALLGQQLGPCGVDGPIYCGGISRAFFEFAPLDGAGMPAACSCTTPTGAKGEVLTFTRASSGTCLKGNTTTGIANGDMVTCSTDQARVMPGGDGTGGNGILVEGLRTNTIIRNQELENVAWMVASNAIAAPTVSVNATVAPDGTTSAEQVQFPAAGSIPNAYSQLYQSTCTASQTNTGSAYIKGNGTSGTLSVRLVDSIPRTCIGCPYVSGSWTRCSLTGALDATVGPALVFGSFSTVTYPCTGSDGAAFDGFIWRPQCEVGPFASSSIATAGVQVARAVDSAYFALTWPAASGWSIATSYLAPSASPVSSALIGGTFYVNATSLYEGYFENDSTKKLFSYVDIAGVNKLNASCTQPITLSALNRLSFSYSGGTVGDVCVNGTCTVTTPTSYTPLSGAVRYYVGAFASANYESDGVSKRVCVDPSGSRCR